MLDANTLVIFFSAAILLALSPGPDNLFVLAQAVQNGSRAGLAVTCGLCTGLFAHTAAVTFGVAALIQTSATAFTLLKSIGAAYLFYLAWQSFRAGATHASTQVNDTPSMGRLYRRGIIMNISNPKVSIFFLAFLPQFADPARGPVSLQLLALGGLFLLATIVVFGGISLAAGRLGNRARQSPKVQQIINRLAGTLFAGLAIKLVLTRQ